jgi:hypothetical protein
MTRWRGIAALTLVIVHGFLWPSGSATVNGYQIDAKIRSAAEATLAKATFEASPTAHRLQPRWNDRPNIR